METTIITIIGVIVVLLILSLIFKGIGFVLKVITNPKVLLIALVICIAIFMTNRLMG